MLEGTTICWPVPSSEGPVKVAMVPGDVPDEDTIVVDMAQSLFELSY